MTLHTIHIGGIAGLSLCASGLLAQPQPSSQRDSARAAQTSQTTQTTQAPQGAGGPPGPSRLRPPLVPEPRFKVEAASVKAIDESGVDWWGSDDVYAVAQALGVPMRTETIKNINTGQQKDFAAGKDCIEPLQVAEKDDYVCNSAGVDGPLSFSVGLYLQMFDWGSLLGHFHPWSPAPDPNDEKVGNQDVALTEAQLLTWMPSPGTTHSEWVHLGSPCGYIEPGAVCGYSSYALGGTGPEYLFIYTITRLADRVVLTPPNH